VTLEEFWPKETARLGWEAMGLKASLSPPPSHGARLGAALGAGLPAGTHRTVSRPPVDHGILGLFSG